MYNRCLSLSLVAWFILVGASAIECFGGQKAATKQTSGDPLPRGAIARLGAMRFRIGNIIQEVSWSPDGKILAAGTVHDRIHLLDAASGIELRNFQADGHHLLFSADSQSLVVGGQDCLQLWDVSTGKLRQQFERLETQTPSIAYAADGKTLAAGLREPCRDSFAYVWDVSTGKQLARIQLLPESTGFVALSHNGKLLATWGSCEQGTKPESSRTIRVWDVTKGKEIRRFVFDTGEVHRVAFCPDGQTLAAVNVLGQPIQGKDRQSSTLRVWNISTGKQVRCFEMPDNIFFPAFTYSPNGKLLAAASEEEKKLYLWDDGTGKMAGPIPHPRCSSLSLWFGNDGNVLACGLHTEWAIRIWKVRTGKTLSACLTGHESPIIGLAFSPDKKSLVTASSDGMVLQWDVFSPGKGKTVRNDDNLVLGSFVLSSDGKYLAGTGPHDRLLLWDLATGKAILKLPSLPLSYQYQMSFSADSSILATNYGNTYLGYWDVRTGHKLRTLSGVWNSFAISSNGRKWVSLHESESPAGGRNEYEIRLWDATLGKVLAAFPLGPSLVRHPVFSPDDRLLAARGPHGSIAVWDLTAQKQILRLDMKDNSINSLVIAPDGKTLAIALAGIRQNEQEIHLVERVTGQTRRCFVGHRGRIGSLAFSKDGKLLASGSEDTTIFLWNVTGLNLERGQQETRLEPRELQALWKDLRFADAAKAYDALWTLVGSPNESVAYLRQHVRPCLPVSADRITQVLADLDSKDFAIRANASEELDKMAEQAEPVVRKALQGNRSPEVRRRLERFLEKLSPLAIPEELGALRAVEVLEHIGTQAAQQVLASIANGASESRLTQEAKASLDRLAKRSDVTSRRDK